MREIFSHFTSSHETLLYGGMGLLLLVIFVETAFPPVGVFLPADFLLFTAGIAANTELLPFSIIYIFLLVMVVAVSGDFAGFYLGNQFERKMRTKERWLFIKATHLDKLNLKFTQHGQTITLIIGRFLPYVRSFIPFMAGYHL